MPALPAAIAAYRAAAFLRRLRQVDFWRTRTGGRIRTGEIIMACPTCEHTMQSLSRCVSGTQYLWCPRCGTLVGDKDTYYDRPAIVERCRQFAGCPEPKNWYRFGIEEAIYPPSESHAPSPQ